MPESMVSAMRSPCGDSRANCKFCNLSAAMLGGFPLRSIQTSCTAPELPLPKVSSPLLVADDACAPGRNIVQDIGRHGLQLAAQFTFIRIKGLRHQLIATVEQQKPSGIDRIGLRVHEQAVLASVQRSVVDAIVGKPRRVVVHGEVQKMFAVGKKEWPAVGGVPAGV